MSSLSKLNKDDLIWIGIDFQNLKFDSDLILNEFKNELSELSKSYIKLKSDLAIYKSVTKIIRKQVFMLEKKSWSSEQYSRREFLKIYKYRGQLAKRYCFASFLENGGKSGSSKCRELALVEIEYKFLKGYYKTIYTSRY